MVTATVGQVMPAVVVAVRRHICVSPTFAYRMKELTDCSTLYHKEVAENLKEFWEVKIAGAAAGGEGVGRIIEARVFCETNPH